MKLKRIATASQPIQPATKSAPVQKPAIQITSVEETTAQELPTAAPKMQTSAPEKWDLHLPKKETTAVPHKTRQVKTPADNSNNTAKSAEPVVDHAAKRKKVLAQVNEFGKECQGKKEYIKFLQGEPVNRTAAIKAKCYDCCGFFEDGRVDCQDHTCPLYPYFQYSSDKSQAVRKNTGNKNPTWLHNKTKTAEDTTNPGVVADVAAAVEDDEIEEGAEIDDDGTDND